MRKLQNKETSNCSAAFSLPAGMASCIRERNFKVKSRELYEDARRRIIGNFTLLRCKFKHFRESKTEFVITKNNLQEQQSFDEHDQPEVGCLS